MSSILTNNGAMVALQTLKSINSDLSTTQSQISTGKSVASAKDNASVWAISKVMESDVKGFQAISDSLALGQSSVAVAANAAETVTDLLTDIKGKIVAAQESNVDREKIQTDIEALTSQIKSVVGAAQFNGLNLVKGTEDVNILSSLDRASDGSVTASDITIARQDLSVDKGSYNASGQDLSVNAVVADTATAVASAGNTAVVTLTGDWDDGDASTITIGNVDVTYTAGADDQTATNAADYFKAQINALGLDGVTAENTAGELTITSTKSFEGLDIAVDHSGVSGGAGAGDITALNGATGLTDSSGTIANRAEQIDFSTSAQVNDGDGYKITIGSDSYNYVAGKNETMEDVAKGLKTAIDAAGIEGVTTKVVQDSTSSQWSLKVDNDGSGSTSLSFGAAGNAGGRASGGLFGLDTLDVTTNAGADSALSNIETLINNSIDAAAEFGSAQGRIESQSNFISNLTDSLKSGIGAMVDADMEEASARLQALQVQQQLGVQSLSIANQAPQTILSLFR
ncbi:flagellin [Celeribacter sp.]|uniref:flagellin N-terminal helical domain-containing protein n=1 Tax=Celeribacter sp. TaxID=1890673 RepID=UPI003A945F70